MTEDGILGSLATLLALKRHQADSHSDSILDEPVQKARAESHHVC